MVVGVPGAGRGAYRKPRRRDDTTAEAIEVESAGSPRALRLTAALGGGLAFDHGARGLLALDVRLETNRRTRFGADAALWLAGGVDPVGRGLITVARGLTRWFELGLGAGIQFGNGTGLASSLRLRADTPIGGLAGYLRYDAAVLLTRPNLEAEYAVTLGLELSWVLQRVGARGRSTGGKLRPGGVGPPAGAAPQNLAACVACRRDDGLRRSRVLGRPACRSPGDRDTVRRSY